MLSLQPIDTISRNECREAYVSKRGGGSKGSRSVKTALSALGAVALVTWGAVITPLGAKVVDALSAPSGDSGTWIDPTSAPSPEASVTPSPTPSPLVGRIVNPDISVHNGFDEGRGSPGTFVITVHNTGTRRIVITHVILTDLSTTEVPECDGEGGGIDISEKYSAELPLDMKVGTSRDVPVRQQEGPDEADSFQITVQLQPSEELLSYYFYRLSVELVTDGDPARVQAGVVEVSLPGVPDPATTALGFFWTDQTKSRMSDLLSIDAGLTKCLHDRDDLVRSFIRLGGVTSPQMSQLVSEMR